MRQTPNREQELHDLLHTDLRTLAGVYLLLPVIDQPDMRHFLLHLATSRADRVGYTARRVRDLIPNGGDRR